MVGGTTTTQLVLVSDRAKCILVIMVIIKYIILGISIKNYVAVRSTHYIIYEYYEIYFNKKLTNLKYGVCLWCHNVISDTY